MQAGAMQWAQLGAEAQEAGNSHEAIEAYQKSLILHPKFAEVHNNLGVIFWSLGEMDQAALHLDQAITLKPKYAEAVNNRGNVWKSQGEWIQAEAAYQRAIELKPKYANAHYNRGTVLFSQDRLAEAQKALETAIRLDPTFAKAWVNLGEIRLELGDAASAAACYEEALAKDPELPEAHWNRALLALMIWEWEIGWKEYEWRWALADQKLRHTEVPRWNGERCGTLLVYVEQGFGDTLQFARFLSLLKSKVGRVVFECQKPLVTFLKDAADQVIELGEAVPPVDAQIPLQSLPGLLKIIPDDLLTIEGRSGKPILSNDKKARRIGICWSGSTVDLRRRLPFSLVRELFEIPEIEWVSLQTGTPREELNSVVGVNDAGAALTDFQQTAELLNGLDLVISIDTATAHLAGVLGIPGWILLPKVPDWRWGLEGERTIWYPSLRLFRQTERGNWSQVVESIKSELI